MALVPWDTLLPSLAPHLNGVPNATMRDALAAATQHFVAQTHLWREEADPITTEADTAEYDVFSSVPIESVLWATLEDTTLAHTDPRLVPKHRLDETGRPSAFWVVNDTLLRFLPIPDGVYTVNAAVALRPSRSAVGVEDWIYEAWADELVSGAIYRLARIPGKHWTDMTLAQYHKTLFDRGIANAKARDLRQIKLRVKPRPV